jgi:VWFA-related protein
MPIRPTAVLAATLLLASFAHAQTPEAAPQEPGPNATVLQTGTQIVVVDVVVQDRDGKPVHGLTAKNFTLTERSQPQTIRHFEEHTPATATASTPAMAALPPGTFSNDTAVQPGGTLTVLLLDSLNTSVVDQTFVRGQLQKFVKQSRPGATLAIFGLTDHLLLLQGFTTDLSVLRDALEHKLVSRGSALLPNAGASGDGGFSEAMRGAADAEQAMNSGLRSGSASTSLMRGNIASFDAPFAQIDAKDRLQFTLDAFHTLARYLSAFPGRKNVIWFAGSFPSHIMIGEGAEVFTVGNGEEYRETGDLLAKAQVAVYPISAQGLAAPSLNMDNSRPLAMTSRAIARDPSGTGMADVIDHSTMEDIAANTGGHAFYNTNGIAQAVHEVVDAGSSYYTLMYTPTDRDPKRGFRSIHVDLVDGPKDLTLSYRNGYYAIPHPQPQIQAAASTDINAFAATTESSHGRYDRAAMTHGAPTPEDIRFKVRVLPIDIPAELTLAPDNALDPIAPVKGPFHRYAVDFTMPSTAITFTPQPDGAHKAVVKFTVYVYNREGKMLVAAHRNFNVSPKPDFYAKLIKGVIDTHMEVSVPDGDTYLRIGIQDVPTDHIGAVEVATADVSKLPPLPVNKRPPPAAPKP